MKLENFVPIKTYTYECWDKTGLSCHKDNALAFSVFNPDTEVTRYYIKGHGRIFYDVQNKEAAYHKKYSWKPITVPKESYEQYVKFLQTKRRRFLTLAERHIGV